MAEKRINPPMPYLKRKVTKGNGQLIIERPDDMEKERLQLEQDPNFISGWSFINHEDPV